MQIKPPTRTEWDAMSPNRRVAEHQCLLTQRSLAVAQARERGAPEERLQRDDLTWIGWLSMTPGEQYARHLDLLIDHNNLADWLQHRGSAPAVTVQPNGIITVAA